ncbi:MAG: HpcH/HpaI aldolase/citrate lyase family protein, partial [Pseudomonadota bacterium]
AFVMGTNDLAKELRGVNDPPLRTAFQTSLGLTVAAARAYDLLAIDGVFNGIGDDVGLTAECQQGSLMGFDGKTLIHPSQIDAANQIFAPAEDDVAQAKAVIAAFADPANAGKGVLKVNGKMTELLHLEEAERTVAVAEAIAAMGD